MRRSDEADPIAPPAEPPDRRILAIWMDACDAAPRPPLRRRLRSDDGARGLALPPGGLAQAASPDDETDETDPMGDGAMGWRDCKESTAPAAFDDDDDAKKEEEEGDPKVGVALPSPFAFALPFPAVPPPAFPPPPDSSCSMRFRLRRRALWRMAARPIALMRSRIDSASPKDGA